MLRSLQQFWENLFLRPRFFKLLAGVAVLFVVSFWVPFLLPVSETLLAGLLLFTLADGLLLYSMAQGLQGGRILPEKLSNGDENEITVYINNYYRFPTQVHILDEIPFQFQKRDFDLKEKFKPSEKKQLAYTLRPVERGSYSFGNLYLYAGSFIGLVQRRYAFDNRAEVPVYPSFIAMRKFEFIAVSERLTQYGIKKIRRVGESTEFDHIREYVTGDDYRKINWKATARKNCLMVNSFSDERSQPVYCIIDKGRVMQMPFEGLSLLDYAINTSLVLSNIVLLRHDHMGLLTFSDKTDTFIKADRRGDQLFRITDSLYRQTTDFRESDTRHLYATVREEISRYSLLLYFTNFDSLFSLKRNLKYLSKIASRHLLVVIFFENTELFRLETVKARNTEDIYVKTVAQKFIFEKRQIVKELRSVGIRSILCSPEDLSVSAVNKYLELKSSGHF